MNHGVRTPVRVTELLVPTLLARRLLFREGTTTVIRWTRFTVQHEM